MIHTTLDTGVKKKLIAAYFGEEKDRIGLVLVLYVALAIVLFKFYQYKLYPDTVSYVSIAKHYLEGEYHNAINGYFAPAYSWLLIPFLFVGFSKLISVKILSLLIGLLTLTALRKFSYHGEISNQIRQLILFISVPVILYFAFFFNTPDLLLVCVLLFYLNAIYSPEYIHGSKKSVTAGVLGAISYFSKHYAFPFFISHFILMNVIHYFRTRYSVDRKKVIKNFILGMTFFLLISGIWVALISHKYNTFTICTSARYVYALMRPETKGHPVGRQGFMNPSNENAISAWEDPSKMEVEGWNPIKSLEFLKHQAKLSLIFFRRILLFLGFSSFFSYAIIFAAVLFLVPFSSKTLREGEFYILATLFLFNLGYVFVLPVERYLWINSLLILLLGGSVLHKLLGHHFFEASARKNLIILFFVGSFLLHPALELAFEINKDRDLYLLSERLKNEYGIQGNIASQSNYKRPLYLCFYLDCQFFGTAREDITCDELFDDLKTNDIDYYFVWERSLGDFQKLARECDDLLNFPEITNGEISGLRIYDVKSKP